MNPHESRLANGGEGRYRSELACPIVETRARPDVVQCVGFGLLGQQREFPPHAFKRDCVMPLFRLRTTACPRSRLWSVGWVNTASEKRPRSDAAKCDLIC